MSSRDAIDDVLMAVSAHFNVSIADILSTRRARRVLTARRVGLYLAHKLSDAHPAEIGARFGGKDDTNVLMACRATHRLAESNPEHALLLQTLERRCCTR